MKKWLAFAFAVMLLLTMVACGNNAAEKTPNADPEDNTGESGQQTTPNTQENPDLEQWGWSGYKSVVSDGSMHVNFRWPVINGSDAHTGHVAIQDDGTVVLVDNFVPNFSPEVDKLADVFPAYFEQTAKVFEDFYDGAYSDGSFTIEKTEKVTVGEHEFLKHTGKHTYKYDGNDRSKQYVLYVMDINLKHAYFYFLVSDVTADQSAGDLMADHAYKMAQSIELEY